MSELFYYLNGERQVGPLTKRELKAIGITPNTLVWKEGMSDWTPAHRLYELRDLFDRMTPPPPPKQNKEFYPVPPFEKRKNSSLSLVMKGFSIAAILMSMAMGIMCSIMVDNHGGSPEILELEREEYIIIFQIATVLFLFFSVYRFVSIVKESTSLSLMLKGFSIAAIIMSVAMGIVGIIEGLEHDNAKGLHLFYLILTQVAAVLFLIFSIYRLVSVVKEQNNNNVKRTGVNPKYNYNK